MKPRCLRGAAILAAAVLLTSLWPATAEAQRRRVVRTAPSRQVVVLGAYYRPLFYDPFFYDPWYPSRYGWYPYAYQRGYNEASVRIQIEQRDAEVFVDGYYAGRVDDFDGVFQRLRLEPGEHEIQVFLAGHRPASEKVYLQPAGSFNIRSTLEPLAAGEAEPLRPAPAPRPSVGTDDANRPPLRGPRRDGRDRDPRVPPGRAPRGADDTAAGIRSEFGSVTFQVQPADAEVFIDGERWQGPRADEALVVQLAPGRHRIEVRKDGYRAFTSEVDVTVGQSVPLNVSLPRQ